MRPGRRRVLRREEYVQSLIWELYVRWWWDSGLVFRVEEEEDTNPYVGPVVV